MKYKLILCDPPWQYSNQATRASTNNHYPTMSINELKALSIDAIADDHSVLVMWYTAAFAKQADELATSWGFTVKTMKLFTWVKLNKRFKDNINNSLKNKDEINADDVLSLISEQLRFGLGNYTRANSEDCLIAIKGKGLTRLDKSVSQLILAPIGEHSEKPKEARILLDRLYGSVPRVELFARQNVDGWDAWGNQCKNDFEL